MSSKKYRLHNLLYDLIVVGVEALVSLTKRIFRRKKRG